MTTSQVSVPIPELKEKGEESVFLMGRPPLEEYLSFMMTEPAGADTADMRLLAEEWRKANDHIKELQVSEKTWADGPSVEQVNEQLASLVADLITDPQVSKSFAVVPFEVVMVELDRLVVFQKYINLGYVEQLKNTLGLNPTDEEIFRLCFPLDQAAVPFRVRRIAPNQFSFVSVSNDLRVMDLLNLRPSQIVGHQFAGHPVGVLAIPVGYGINFLSAISVEGRLILLNASHRAYALRDLNIKKVPCIVQKVTRREELNIVAAGTPLLQSLDFYLKEPRPPVLKDYFDPALRKIVRLSPKARQVRVGVAVEVSDIPWD